MATDGAELAARVDAEARMAAALVELERHPELAAGTCTGVTAERWTAASATLAGLWADFAIYRRVLDDARARPTERRRLLREAAVELNDRETITLDALAARMNIALREVGDVVTACDATHRAVFAALAPLADRARAALAVARELDLEGPTTARLAGALADVERALVHDPLAFADRPVEDVLAPLADALEPVTRRCAELVAVRGGWETGLADLERALTAAEALRADAERAGRRARELIAGADPTPPDRLPPLRERLAALPRIPGWPARADAVQDLWAAVADTTAALRTTADAAAGLVDRRGELRGRFEAYRAKATRLGVAERPDVLAAGDRVRDLLWTRPCDLAAATVAVVVYQRLIRDGG
jgi:hypothetical protein